MSVSKSVQSRAMTISVRSPTMCGTQHPNTLPDVDAAVAEQPVHLLDRLFALEARRERRGSADGVDAKGCALQHARRGVRERGHPLGVQVVGEDGGDELEADPFMRTRSRGWSFTRRQPDSLDPEFQELTPRR